jgi:hypothetical protein
MKLNEFSDSLIKTVLSYKEGNANEIISKFKYVTNDEQKNKVLAIIYLELLQFLVSRGAPIDIKPLYTPPASGSGSRPAPGYSIPPTTPPKTQFQKDQEAIIENYENIKLSNPLNLAQSIFRFFFGPMGINELNFYVRPEYSLIKLFKENEDYYSNDEEGAKIFGIALYLTNPVAVGPDPLTSYGYRIKGDDILKLLKEIRNGSTNTIINDVQNILNKYNNNLDKLQYNLYDFLLDINRHLACGSMYDGAMEPLPKNRIGIKEGLTYKYKYEDILDYQKLFDCFALYNLPLGTNQEPLFDKIFGTRERPVPSSLKNLELSMASCRKLREKEAEMERNSGSGSVKESFENPHGFGLGFTAIKTTTPPLSEFDDDYYENDNNYYNKPRKYSYQYTDVPTHKNDMVLLPEMAWSVPMRRPPVCTTLGQEPLIQPLYDNSKLLLGTPLNEDTSVGTIMPEFQYKEYVTIPQ